MISSAVPSCSSSGMDISRLLCLLYRNLHVACRTSLLNRLRAMSPLHRVFCTPLLREQVGALLAMEGRDTHGEQLLSEGERRYSRQEQPNAPFLRKADGPPLGAQNVRAGCRQQRPVGLTSDQAFGVKPSTMSKWAESSPMRDSGRGTKGTMTEARCFGSRMPWRMPSCAFRGSPWI